MNRKLYLQQAISALTKAIQLPETQQDEDRTYQEVIKLLMRMLQEYGQDAQAPQMDQPQAVPQMAPQVNDFMAMKRQAGY